MLTDDFIDGVYEFGEDDWVQFIDLGHLLIEETGTNEDLIRRGGAAATELIRRGVMVPGFIGDGGFEPWDLTEDAAVRRIEQEAHQIARERSLFRPGDICWFQTTNYEG